MAAPGTTHYGYYFISYQFVYVGNVHGKRIMMIIVTIVCYLVEPCILFVFLVRNTLIVFAMFSLLGAAVVTVTSTIIIMALRKVSEPVD